MNIEIRKSTEQDLAALLSIFDEARGTIKQLGIDQWQNGYPHAEVIRDDISRGESYSVTCDGEICATFALIEGGEPTYDKIYDGAWLTGYSPSHTPNYFAIHRVAISVRMRGQGIATKIIDFAAQKARAAEKRSLRIDTHRGNVVMRRMLEKHGFAHCGTILLQDGAERVAYEKAL
jgi:GNAT superfamily N-acetyltransferase